jgi:hypothetical protein
MRRILGFRPSPALIISVLALVGSTAGTALGAGALSHPGSGTTPSAEASASVKSLAKKYAKKYAKRYAKLYARRGPRGATGPKGSRGSRGPTGRTGGFNTSKIARVDGPTASVAAGATGTSTAPCPAGAVVLGGGWDGETNPPTNATVGYNDPLSTNTSWHVTLTNNATTGSTTFHAVVMCAKP